MRRLHLPPLLALLATSACELEKVTLVQSEDVVVAEVYVQAFPLRAGNRVAAFLHRTLATQAPVSLPVPGASVVITRSDGLSLELGEAPLSECVTSTPVEGTGTCYWAAPGFASRIQPGDSLELRIDLPDGGVLRSATVVPGDFVVQTSPHGNSCALAPLTSLEVAWTPSSGAWAYLNETYIAGLRDALAPKGIEVQEDPLYLLGLSVGAQDTTVVFPKEFGVFDRFSLDQDVALALQDGLPDGTEAAVTITAANRNYVNWIRGGNFNPSGVVRVPSIEGDGTGVFGATVSRDFHIVSNADGTLNGYPLPLCTGSGG